MIGGKDMSSKEANANGVALESALAIQEQQSHHPFVSCGSDTAGCAWLLVEMP